MGMPHNDKKLTHTIVCVNLEDYVKWNKSDIEAGILYNPIYMKFPEKTKLQEAQGKIAIAWGWEWGRDCCKWVQGSLLGGGSVLKLDCGDGFVQLYEFIKKSWLNFMECKL